MPSLAVIIVSWNVRDLLRRCLRAVEASLAGSGIDYAILVVDNASSDGTPAMLRAEFPHVSLLEPGRNLGFAAGNNLALREVLRVEPGGVSSGASFSTQRVQHQAQIDMPNPRYDYVLLLNPDTETVADAIPRLLRELEARPELVAVGPQLRYPDGSVQSSRRRFPTRLTFFWESTPLAQLWPGNPWARRYHCADRPDNVAQPVDWLVGAALLVRAPAITRAGLLDEGFFMYSEELEWQLRLQRDFGSLRGTSNIQHPTSNIAFVPAAVIIHYEGKSSEQVLAVRHLHFQHSKLRLARMCYGGAFALLLRLFLQLCYLWEIGVEGVKLLIGHRRALRRQRIGVYATVLRKL